MAYTQRRRTITFATAASVLATLLFVSVLLVPEKNGIDAYSILPLKTTTTTYSRGIRWNPRERRIRTFQRPTLLRAAQGYDCVQNATAMGPAAVVVEEGEDYEDIRFLRFMQEALSELESFQESSSAYDCEHEIVDTPKDTTRSNSELSLLFPQMVATPIIDADPISMKEDASAPLMTPDDDSSSTATEDAVWRARWLLIAAAALYGTNFSVVKLLGDEMPVGISSSFRFGLAALATLPWLLDGFLPNLTPNGGKSGDDSEAVNRRVMATMYGLEVGLWNSIGYVAQAVGLETTLASESAFLCSMAVVVVPLLDWLAGKKLLPRQWAGALMALVGVGFLELGGVDLALLSSGGGGGDHGFISTGDALSMVQPFTFGLGFWRMEQAMNQFPEEAQRMTAAQLMAVFLASVSYGLWTLGVFDHTGGVGIEGLQSSFAAISTAFPWKEWFTSPTILFSLFWTGCITTALTIYMETLALESLSAAETTLIFSTEPLWGTAFAVAVMGEQMGMNAAVGAGLILTACIYSNLGIQGVQELWASSMSKVFAKDNNQSEATTATKHSPGETKPLRRSLWPWIPSGLVGTLATWNLVAADPNQNAQDLDVVDGLIDNLVDKM